jgi:hypothetical protein
VLYFTDGTPRQHRRDRDYRPDMVSTVKRPGTDSSLQSNLVEGALFSKSRSLSDLAACAAHWLLLNAPTTACELRSNRMGGSKTIYWMIEPKWQRQRPEVGQRVGWATTVIPSAGPGNTWDMVPVWATDRWDLGNDSSTREKVIAMYYFQNDFGYTQPSPKPGFLQVDVPAGRPRARSETRYTMVQREFREDDYET